uniref:DnaJ sub C member 1 n=1 Tax=Sphaerodactylus townsendi TaxID=933632 RepID=A0ACB8FVG9_9SAUR
MKKKEEAQERAELETLLKEKKPKVKKPKPEFPVYTAAETKEYLPSYDHVTSIEEIEEQMDDWLEDRNKSLKKKASVQSYNLGEGKKWYNEKTQPKYFQ